MKNEFIKQPLLSIQYGLFFLWFYQGLIPKILFPASIEIQIWQKFGFEFPYIHYLITLSGVVEIIFALIFLKWNHTIVLHSVNIIALIALLILIVIFYPFQLVAAFNPVVMNIAMITLSIIAIQCINLQKT